MNLLKKWFKIKKNKTAYKHEHDFYFFYFLGKFVSFPDGSYKITYDCRHKLAWFNK